MEAPPPPITNDAANPTTAASATATATATYPDSMDSSPHSSWDSTAADQKLRVMCSFGGHILPRPHDKSLCYLGGETRIIAIDRQNTSLSDLHDRLSKTLLVDHPKPFSLKYQLPSEDLDSLISLATDEDLDNMVDEYDRLADNIGRLRLFVFSKTTPSSSSLPPLSSGNSSCNLEQMFLETVASTKSEEWFLNALNWKPARPRVLGGAASDRVFSETSSVNCLLGLDDDDSFLPKTAANAKDVAVAVVVESNSQLEGGLGSKSGGNPSGTGSANAVANNNSNNNLQDVHSIPDSPIMLETTSSFGSTSSSPSVVAAANLAPIRVHVVEENQNQRKVLGIEEQFHQMSVVGNVNLQQQQEEEEEEVGGFTPVVSGVVPVVVGSEYPNWVFSDDERSDHSGYRKVQQIHPQVLHQFQQPYQQQQIPPQLKQAAGGGAFDLQSPDSVSSDGSITNPLSRHRQALYQEPIMQMQPGNNTRVVAVSQPDPRILDQNNPKVNMQPKVQESGYVLPGQYDQDHPQLHHLQQFIHPGTQYISAGAVPMGSYYHIYPSQQQHHQHQPVLDQQHPVYYIPARQTQPYNLPVQPTASSSHPQTPPAAVGGQHSALNQKMNAPTSKPEMVTGVYRQGPQLVQVPLSQHQTQYVGYTQIHHPSQLMGPPAAANSGYAYEFSDPALAQMYYTQPSPAHLAAQYQTVSSARAMEVSAQVPMENVKQQVRTLQP